MMGVARSVELATLDIVGGRVRTGELAVTLPNGDTRTYRGRTRGPVVRVTLHDEKLLRRLATLGAIGLADGYVSGDFDTNDLARLIELAALHLEQEHATHVPRPLARLGRSLWQTLGNAAAPRGPLPDTISHYNIGNAFFALWLDPTMTYSSAVFSHDDMTLEDAQREKYRRLAEATGLRTGDRVLEIGCGWGGFAVYATEELGCHVTATTVSREQFDHVRKLVADRGLVDRIEPRLEDVRATEGAFDHIVSIEMMESIPQSLWAPYFRQLHDLTRPGGTIGLQVITVADRHWATSNTNPDFVRRYVFPGGQVPAPMVLRGLARRHGLRWIEDHGYGASYARTLQTWGAAFEAHEQEIADMGFDEPFRRMWRYYLAYCEGGFRAGRVDVSQIVLARAA